jgi:RNA polymerase sigma factor (sigma-70 family)
VTWLEPHEGQAADATSLALDARSMAASPRTDPAMLAIRAERAADLRGAVATLQEPYREVVGLRFFGELSLEEIARQTERPLATVKTQLRRGLLLLRATVEPRSDT